MAQARATYEFDKCLGRGGYGEVYLCRQHRPGGLTRKVAVKILRAGIGREKQAVKRLRDEGRMLAVLDHPAILGVIEMTSIAGRVALVTEYIEGIDASRCCRRGFLMPQRVVIGIIGEVAAALHTAWHTPSPETGQPLELIHRDIKPENIRVSRYGEVKLLDFGIARSTQMAREAQTAAGSMPFTVGYAAPESFNEGVQVHKSDVFALGVTLYRMLVGERLYEGLDLSSQLSVNSSRDRFEKYITKRMSRVNADDSVVELLRDMLTYDLATRPTADDVARRCEDLADELSGQTHVRWARGKQFSEPAGIPGAELTGQKIEADQLGAGLDFDRDEVSVEDEPTQPAPAVDRRKATPPAAPTSTPPPASTPPPVPLGLTGLKPDTAPFVRGSDGDLLPLDSLVPTTTAAPPSDPPSLAPRATPSGVDSLPIPSGGLQTLPESLLGHSLENASDVETLILPRDPELLADSSAPPPAPRGGMGFKVLLAVVTLGVFGVVVLAGVGLVFALLW